MRKLFTNEYDMFSHMKKRAHCGTRPLWANCHILSLSPGHVTVVRGDTYLLILLLFTLVIIILLLCCVGAYATQLTLVIIILLLCCLGAHVKLFMLLRVRPRKIIFNLSKLPHSLLLLF